MHGVNHGSRDRSVLASTVMLLTCVILGLLTGGMLVIGVSLVSFWKSLSPAEFHAWFASYSHLLGRLMIPLGVASIAITVTAVVVSWRSSATDRGWLLVAAGSALAVMVTYPLFFEATNEAFVRGGLSDAAVRSLLERWAMWHWVRTALGAVGFVAALRALHG